MFYLIQLITNYIWSMFCVYCLSFLNTALYNHCNIIYDHIYCLVWF